MGHRHLYSSSSMFENDHDPNENHVHAVQTDIHSDDTTTLDAVAENSSSLYPAEQISMDGVHLSPYWNFVPRPNGYSSPSLNGEAPYYQPDGSGPFQDPYQNLPNNGIFYTVPENYAHQSASSSYDRHRETFHGVDGSFVDLTMNNGRRPCKRKNPGIPGVNERGSTSRYHGAGSSSDHSVASDLLQEKPNTDSQQHWEHNIITPCHAGDHLTFVDEASSRNVRLRSALYVQSNLSRAHLLNNASNHHYPNGYLANNCSSMNITGQNSRASNVEWNHNHASPTSHGRIHDSDTAFLNHQISHSFVGGSSSNAANIMEIHGCPDEFNSSRNPVVPQSFQSSSAPSARGIRSGYIQRGTLGFRASSSNLRLGHVPSSDDSLQLIAENYAHRHPRPPSSLGWRSSDRNGRARIHNERYFPHYDDSALHHRLVSEGLIILDQANLHGSRNILDQHRDMRLDIDNMSYEELLALEETIGNVNTGLSEDLVSNCLTETTYSSLNLTEEERCVICLEEYKNMDDIGLLKICGHDYHVGCIKKWLSLKNSCPICKTSAQDKKTEQ